MASKNLDLLALVPVAAPFAPVREMLVVALLHRVRKSEQSFERRRETDLFLFLRTADSFGRSAETSPRGSLRRSSC